MEKLKSCPFCGGEAKMFTSLCNNGYLAEVYCASNYDVGCFVSSKHFAQKASLAKEAAIKAWNRRAKL